MLTENAVDKIDSIDPADIETHKAPGRPKGASSGYVLTADGNGKATYKYKSGGTLIQWKNGDNFSLKGFKTNSDGNKYIEKESQVGSTAIILSPYFKVALTANGVVINPTDFTLMIFKEPVKVGFRIYFSDAVIAKYNFNAETQFAGSIGYSYYYQ